MTLDPESACCLADGGGWVEKSAAFQEAGVGVVRGPGFPSSEVRGPRPRKEPPGDVDHAMVGSREKQRA